MYRPSDIMKWKLLIAMLLAAMFLLSAGAALAETVTPVDPVDPVVCSMEITPSTLTQPGTVDVTINISNSGNTDMKDPVILYDPTSQVVSDFGTNGSVLLKAGQSETWTGKWDVNQRTLENGSVVFFVKYTLYKDSGESYSQSQPIRAKLSAQAAAADIEIKRTISPATAREGQEVTVKYDITNTGTVTLKNVTVQENKDINDAAQKIPELKPGEMAQVKFPVTMKKANLTSSATITYEVDGVSTKVQEKVEAVTIAYGEPAMSATLTSSAKGVAVNDKFKLLLELKNKGTVDYTNLQVTDSTLGTVFTNQSLAKNGTLTLEKEITLTATTEYQFVITAIDNTGTEVSLSTDAVKVEVVDLDKSLHLTVITTPDRTEVYEQPGKVRFSVTVTNDSEVDAKDVDILHGTTKIYTFSSIPAGESRSLTRDAALSSEGKYQFTASTVDALGATTAFKSNEVQIAFSLPTPAPATPTPVPNPTAVPTFSPVTMQPISHESIALVPKIIQSILLPILIVCGLMLIGSGVLLIIATKRRAEQKKASEAAYDHLERSKRRDYVTPSQPDEEEQAKAVQEKHRDTNGDAAEKDGRKPSASKSGKNEIPLDDVELPHMKYVRSAFERSNEGKQQSYHNETASLYDDELYGDEDVFTSQNNGGVMYEESDEYADDGYANESSESAGKDQDNFVDYADEYADDKASVDGHYADDRLADTDDLSKPSEDYRNASDDDKGERPARRAGRLQENAKGSDLGY